MFWFQRLTKGIYSEEGVKGVLPQVKLLSFWCGEKQTHTRKFPFCVISSHSDAEMDNQARALCSDLLLPKLSPFFWFSHQLNPGFRN